MESLKLDNFLKIDDEDLVTSCKLSTLTFLEVTQSDFGSRNITDMGVSFLTNLRALQELHLANSGKIRNVGMQHFVRLTFLIDFYGILDVTSQLGMQGTLGV